MTKIKNIKNKLGAPSDKKCNLYIEKRGENLCHTYQKVNL